MDNLNQSTFFDNRIKNFLYSILYLGQYPNPINDFEKTLIENQDDIRELNKALDGELLKLMTDAQDYVAYKDSLIFLRMANKKGKVEDAKFVLHVAYREGVQLDRKALKKMISESNEIPMSWAVNLYGEEKDARYERKQENKPSIDIKRLRDFK